MISVSCKQTAGETLPLHGSTSTPRFRWSNWLVFSELGAKAGYQWTESGSRNDSWTFWAQEKVSGSQRLALQGVVEFLPDIS